MARELQVFTLPAGSYPYFTQKHWAVARHSDYLRSTGLNTVGPRRLHYYIVTRPHESRIIPSRRSCTYRYYENAKEDYQKLSGHLVDARIEGLIDPASVVDEKNEPVIFMPARREMVIDIYTRCDLPGEVPYYTVPDEMPEWDKFVESIHTSLQIQPPAFTHQSHRLVIAIEKATARSQLQTLAQRHGADLLVFSGQFSVSRVFDVASAARAEQKPIALFYISDLDCAGWDMPTGFFSRLKDIYPHPDHKIFRVGLTREQAERYQLPVSFDPDDKGYEKSQKERFYRESGGRECIELDALDENVLISLLSDQLKHWSNLAGDDDEYQDADEWAREIRDNLDISSILEKYRIYYSGLSDEYNGYVDEIRQVLKHIPDNGVLDEERTTLEARIKTSLQNAIRSAFNNDPRIRIDPLPFGVSV